MSKNENKINQSDECHPLLPSGEWEGFYCYHYSSEQHKMFVELKFSESNISGTGIDDVAPFTWKGKYDLDKFKVDMNKYYSTHVVWYKGDIDENGIWGLWEISMDRFNIPQSYKEMVKNSFKNELTGGFHIWPKKSRSETTSNSLEEQKESKKLKELFVEVFG
ncbi:MAG: hypothetical protein AAGA77_22670 [Bacteroidota bacterium]